MDCSFSINSFCTYTGGVLFSNSQSLIVFLDISSSSPNFCWLNPNSCRRCLNSSLKLFICSFLLFFCLHLYYIRIAYLNKYFIYFFLISLPNLGIFDILMSLSTSDSIIHSRWFIFIVNINKRTTVYSSPN